MMAEVAQKVLTWEDYLKGEPKELERYEIVDGEVMEVGAPNGEHQLVSRNLFRSLDDFVTHRELGVVLYAPFDVVVRKEPLKTRQPDLFFLSKERGGTPENIRQLARLEATPDLVVEIFSPSEERERLGEKLDDYHRIGVPEVWLVRSEEKTVEVLVRMEEGWRWHGLFSDKETVKSAVLEGLDFPVTKIFA